MIIEHDLLRKQKRRKQNKKVQVDIYPCATELWEELDKLRIIDRIKNIPQLGVIKIKDGLSKSRFDYMVLQLYFHQLIKRNLQGNLKNTYNNPVNAKEFRDDFIYPETEKKPSIGDLLQLFSIVYNVGHFYNTFVASRAVIMWAKRNSDFKRFFLASTQDKRCKDVIEKILDEENYHRFHLINSLLILEKCSQDKFSVVLAKELIYAYLNQDELSPEGKLDYIFRVYRSVRSVAFVAYDLQISRVPLTIDLGDDNAITLFFSELLSEYNNRNAMRQLVNSISKMLDDTVYNEKSNAICYYNISKKIVFLGKEQIDFVEKDYYLDFWENKDSILNKRYPQSRGYCEDGILKLTFDSSERDEFNKLLYALDHMNNVSVGYYDRYEGESTVLVSIKKKCEFKSKIALCILKTVVKHLREIRIIHEYDIRYLLVTKFFLQYLFDQRPVIIKPTIEKDVCVLCTRGKKQRISSIQRLLDLKLGNNDQRHEVDHMIAFLQNDNISDTTITIPGSIEVYDKMRVDQKLCEFDGMILFPLRNNKQLVFLEAKNTKESAGARKCLCKKMDKLKIPYEKEKILDRGKDVYLETSI